MKLYSIKYKFGVILTLLFVNNIILAQNDFNEIKIDAEITHVQPMTGIVFWDGQHQNIGVEVTSLEFSYMLYSDVVQEQGVYDWTVVENKLNQIASRGHQAVFRFRYVYVGEETAVPDYIKALPGYHETEGVSEGENTWFPDWTNQELQNFTLEFYTKFAEKYDNDPRLAFLETGFGLWAEYHIYDGPFEPGVTFPSKEFQIKFFRHMDTTFINIPFMISIDAANNEYSPFDEHPELLNIKFGNFDDSFMNEDFDVPGEYNTESWEFFGPDRYKYSPEGGEFSYYTTYDQKHVLDWPDGPYGKPYEYFAKKYHISFIIGNDQPLYQTKERIKQAGMASGYLFKIVSFFSKQDSSVVLVKNLGTAPIYYDAYVAVNDVRSEISLKNLAPGDSIVCPVSAGGENPKLTVISDRLVEGQSIEYLGTENFLKTVNKNEPEFLIFPNPVKQNESFTVSTGSVITKTLKIYNINGQLKYSSRFDNASVISVIGWPKGIYLVSVDNGRNTIVKKLIVR